MMFQNVFTDLSWIFKSFSAATADATAANKTWIFESKWQYQAGKHFRNTYWLSGSSNLAMPVSQWAFLQCFQAHRSHFDLKIAIRWATFKFGSIETLVI